MNSKRTHLRVAHSLPPLQFAPFFVALGLRLFEEAGIQVDTFYDDRRQQSVEMLTRGEIDCFLSGPLRTFDLAAKGIAPPMASIAVINHRCPFYLIGLGAGARTSIEGLSGRRVIVRRSAPPANLLLRRLVRMSGIDVDSIEWVEARDQQTEVEALFEGLGDYAMLAEPEVEVMVSSSQGHIALSLPEELGPLHFASVVAPQGFIDEQADLARVVVRSVQQAKDWMCGHSSEEVAAALSAFMPGIAPDIVARAVRRSQRDGLWAGGPAMARWHYESVREAYIGENDRLKSVPFRIGVDNRVANEMQESG